MNEENLALMKSIINPSYISLAQEANASYQNKVK